MIQEKPIKLLIFDVGGVITHTDFKKLYSDFALHVGISPDFVVNYHKKYLDDLLLGSKTLSDFWEDMRRGSTDKDADFQKVWLEEAIKTRNVDSELLDLIDQLRKEYKVCTLTNLTPSRLIIDEAQNLYSHFDDNILSCVEHLKKPDLAFYQLALQRFGVEAEEAIFVDDKQSLIDVSESIGIKGILFENTSLFRDQLSKVGINL